MHPPIVLPIPPLAGEQALLRAPARYLLTTPTGWGYNPINGELTLTSQRLVFKPDGPVSGVQRIAMSASGAAVVWFPIHRVTECSEQPLKVQWGKPNVLRLQFDNGGREYFVVHPSAVQPVGTWAAELTNAKAAAPALGYEREPALKPGFEQPAGRGAQRLLVYWVVGVVAACMACAVVALVVNSLSG